MGKERGKEHGQFTRFLGEDLKARISETFNDEVSVIYDHGKSGMPKVVPYFGRYSTATTLSNVDCALVYRDRVFAVCEIEEETATPKKIIGDLCNLLLADRVRIAENDYRIDTVHAFLGVRIRDGGKGEDKAKSLKRLIIRSFRKRTLRDIRIHVLCSGQPDVLIRSASEAMMKIVPNHLRK